MKYKHAQSRSQRRRGTSYRHIKIQHGESRHHRNPVSLGGGDEPDNISVVKKVDHDHWHAMFSNYTPETIAAIISEKWLPKGCRFICERLC